MKFININQYVGEKKRKGQMGSFLIILVMIVLYTNAFGYVGWNSTYGGWIKNIIAIIFLAFMLLNWPKSRKFHFRSEMFLLSFLPFLSILNTNSLYGQGYLDSIKTLSSGCLVWIFYILLHKYKVQEATILKVFLAIALFVVAVQVIQQFTYPHALFGIRNEETMAEKGLIDYAEQRNGLWRFRLNGGQYFPILILFACAVWIRERFNNKLMILIIFMLISVYLSLTRQIIAACLLALFCSFFLGKKNSNYIQAVLIGVIIASLIYSYSDVLFGSLAEQTKDDMSDSYIRVLSGTYFWNESISSPLVFLFGHGLPGQTGSFKQLMSQLNQIMGYYPVDVGFIGMTYTFGSIYVVVCYRLLWKIFFTFKKYTPMYIRLYVIFGGVMSIMIFPMESTINCLIWAILMYITDLYIEKGVNVNNIMAKKKITIIR